MAIISKIVIWLFEKLVFGETKLSKAFEYNYSRSPNKYILGHGRQVMLDNSEQGCDITNGGWLLEQTIMV